MEKHIELSKEVKYEKMKLHIKYLIAIAIGIIGITIVAACFTNKVFVDQISFASTITSIILSVIAIIMTIVGENKSENTKDKLINLSENLESIVIKIEKTTDEFNNISVRNQKMESKIDNIGSVIENQYASISKDSAKGEDNSDTAKMDKQKNSHIDVINEASENVNYEIFKNLCITILYIDARFKTEIQEITYQEYIDANKMIGMNISDNYQLIVWTMASIFLKAILNDSQFVEHVYNISKNKYSSEVNKIEDFVKNKQNQLESKQTKINN